MADYIWSDLHLYHKKILDYTNRPFKDIGEMNKTLLDNWKKIITKYDKLFCLGDFSFNRNTEDLKKLLKNLPGYKILIMGNHDRRKSVKGWLESGFNEVYFYPIIYKDFYIFSHEPVFLNDHMPYINCHGHIHDNNFESKQFVNVCVEQIGYKPILFEEIENKFIEEN
jgi:calcineurin-like phosphoesterase family protein